MERTAYGAAVETLLEAGADETKAQAEACRMEHRK